MHTKVVGEMLVVLYEMTFYVYVMLKKFEKNNYKANKKQSKNIIDYNTSTRIVN